MGLLDDAIREHLELKKRHGAPEDEVKRQEHEALGPIRRRGDPEPEASETEATAAPGEAAETLPEATLTTPDEGTGIVVPPPAAPSAEQAVMPEPAGHEPVIEDFPAAEGPAAVPARGPAFTDDEPWLDDSPEAPPEDLLDGASPDPAATAALPVEEDVLEETPDFLQETPEHDRLWFEQRPPRGFDFEQ